MIQETELDGCVRAALEEYFKDLDGEPPHAMYDMLIQCVEKPLLQFVMNHAGGNQSKAAMRLGTTKRILSYRVRKYGIDLGRFHKTND